MSTMDDVVIENQTQTKERVKRPPRYAVIFHNDDYTSMEFVILVLIELYHKTYEDARFIMLTVHDEGSAIVDIFSKEVAEEKVAETMNVAKINNFPLLATAEEYDDEE